jgi:hypothetical protein
MKPCKPNKAGRRTQQTRKKPGQQGRAKKADAGMNALQGFFYSSKKREGKYIKYIYAAEGGETNPANPHNPARSICAPCELVAFTSKDVEVPLNHPSASGVAYRQPPKHGGGCREAWTPPPQGPSLLDALDAEGRKLEGP